MCLFFHQNMIFYEKPLFLFLPQLQLYCWSFQLDTADSICEILLWFLIISNKNVFCNKPSSVCRCRHKVLGLKINKINGFRNGLASALSEEENKHNEVMNQFALSFVCLTLQTKATERAKSFKELLQVKKGICNQLLQIHSGISLPQNLNKEGIPGCAARTRVYRALTRDQKNTNYMETVAAGPKFIERLEQKF